MLCQTGCNLVADGFTDNTLTDSVGQSRKVTHRHLEQSLAGFVTKQRTFSKT